MFSDFIWGEEISESGNYTHFTLNALENATGKRRMAVFTTNEDLSLAYIRNKLVQELEDNARKQRTDDDTSCD